MAEFIEEACANLNADNLPIYYKYRYTFNKDEQDLESQKCKFKLIYNFIRSHYLIGDRIVGGIEHYTKGMVAAKPHLHIHFISKSKSDTIRKGLGREYNMIGRCQSCKAEVIVDESKFWRYPLKQQDGDTARYMSASGFIKEDLLLMKDIAFACWKQSAEIAVLKVEKKLERSTRERLFSYFDGLDYFSIQNKDLVTLKQSYILAYQYYAENEESVCVKTIDGYVNQYCLVKGYITYDKFYELTH